MKLEPKKSYKTFGILIIIALHWVSLSWGKPISEGADDVAAITEAARVAMQEGRWADAEPLIRKLMVLNEEDPKNFRRLGQILFNLDRFKEAEPLLQKALESGDVTALSAMALTKLRLKKNEWVEQNEEMLFAQLNKGDVHCLSPLALWSITQKDPEILVRALERVDDQELAKNPMLAYAVLGAYRYHLKTPDRGPLSEE
jgi:tetratricopeptide (TPR) repeat protein